MTQSAIPRVPFQKAWLSYADQVALLVSRGLVVADPTAAEAFLAHINYYRFSGYCLAFEQARHQFQPGVTFEDIRAAYEFDRVLRDLMTDGLEVFEIDVRTALAHQFGRQYGAFGHTSPAAFYRCFKHLEWITKVRNEIGRSSETFVAHFRQTYTEFPDLPVWAVTEIVSFGALSKMFSGMLASDQRTIANRYGLQARTLESWMHHLVYVRNLCAHHARIWDRVWTIKPRLPHGTTWQPPHLPGNGRLFATVRILNELMRRCGGHSQLHQEWQARVQAHLRQPPSCTNPSARMGLPPSWESSIHWR